MNKKVLLVSGIVVVIVIFMYFLFISKHKDKILVSPAFPEIVNNIKIKKLFNFNKYFEGEKSLCNLTSSYINPVTKYKISFKAPTNGTIQSTNPICDIYYDNNKIGEVSGMGMGLESFSPDGKYFVFRARTNIGCAGICQSTDLYIVDLDKSTITETLTPSFTEGKKINKNNIYDNVSNFIKFFSWSGSNILDIDSFAVGLDKKTGKYYQISPENIWEYNINTKQYTLVQPLDK